MVDHVPFVVTVCPHARSQTTHARLWNELRATTGPAADTERYGSNSSSRNLSQQFAADNTQANPAADKFQALLAATAGAHGTTANGNGNAEEHMYESENTDPNSQRLLPQAHGNTDTSFNNFKQRLPSVLNQRQQQQQQQPYQQSYSGVLSKHDRRVNGLGSQNGYGAWRVFYV